MRKTKINLKFLLNLLLLTIILAVLLVMYTLPHELMHKIPCNLFSLESKVTLNISKPEFITTCFGIASSGNIKLFLYKIAPYIFSVFLILFIIWLNLKLLNSKLMLFSLILGVAILLDDIITSFLFGLYLIIKGNYLKYPQNDFIGIFYLLPKYYFVLACIIISLEFFSFMLLANTFKRFDKVRILKNLNK